LKLKDLPEFPVTNSKGDFLGVRKYSRFLKNVFQGQAGWGSEQPGLEEGDPGHGRALGTR